MLYTSIVSASAACRKKSSDAQVDAVFMQPAISTFRDDVKILPGDLTKLLKALEGPDSQKVTIVSSATEFVAEPPALPGITPVGDLEDLGYGKTKFLADSRWATIRYVSSTSGNGTTPAGAGLAVAAQNEAQIAAIGKKNDSIPVVTAALTITKIMDEYFVPLLEQLPNGTSILSAFKIQGAYFAPDYIAPNGSRQRDNAFMVGLQSLQLWPSSCFENSQSAECKPPYMSTGHDPTVIGHEVAHAVFNHLRGGRSLDGFQWNAVNEGYADYFAGSYYAEPRIGRTWKVAGINTQHLRTIDGKPTAENAELITEAHKFSTVWSSTLWRIRNRLIAQKKAPLPSIDSMILYSIAYLGETASIRLGDAGIALLKSAEATNHTDWKSIVREELSAAEIALSQASSTSSDAIAGYLVPASETNKNENGCGTLATAQPLVSQTIALIPIFVSACLGAFQSRRKRQ
jgi:hypothetical protein